MSAQPTHTSAQSWTSSPDARAADEEAHLVANVAEYFAAGGPEPRNRAERRELARRLTRRKGRGLTR